MHCSMTDVNIRILLDENKTPFRFDRLATGGSLQNPELSRVLLAAMIRHAERLRRDSGNGWNALLGDRAGRCANANTQAG